MSRFRNAELSPPIPGHGVRLATLYSPALKRRADMTLYLPEPQPGKPLPLLILLHGVYGSHWNWWIMGKAPEIAREMMEAGEIFPFCIAMPSDGLWGDGSGYVPHRDFDAEAWISEDVPGFIREFVPAVEANRFYIAGLSMGGFGALRLGMKYANRVKGISAHSSVTSVEDLERFVREPLEEYRFSGAENVDILHWARKHRAMLPPIRFDCGTEDSLLEANRSLHAALEDQRIPHIYEEHEGGHTWDYWQTHVRRTFSFVSEIESQA
ncbi:MAG: alpha/beta hydrolase [Acidobacteriaceae bacterium]